MSEGTSSFSKLFRIPLGFGGAALSGEGGGYGFGSINEKESQDLLSFAWEQGIRLYDTAPIYGFGISEERMGKFLPAEAFIITKGGVHWHESKRVNMTNDPIIMEEMILASLKRLKREVIDLYMIHWPDANVDIRRPLEVLKKYQDQHKIKHIGLCNTNPSDFEKSKEVCEVVALQSEFNLFHDQNFSALPSGLLTMGWGTLDKGILSGRVDQKRSFEKDDCRSWAPWWNKKEVQEKVARVQRFMPELEQKQISLQHFAIQYALSEGIRLPLVGSKSIKDLKQMLELVSTKIPQAVMQELKTAWKKS